MLRLLKAATAATLPELPAALAPLTTLLIESNETFDIRDWLKLLWHVDAFLAASAASSAEAEDGALRCLAFSKALLQRLQRKHEYDVKWVNRLQDFVVASAARDDAMADGALDVIAALLERAALYTEPSEFVNDEGTVAHGLTPLQDTLALVATGGATPFANAPTPLGGLVAALTSADSELGGGAGSSSSGSGSGTGSREVFRADDGQGATVAIEISAAARPSCSTAEVAALPAAQRSALFARLREACGSKHAALCRRLTALLALLRAVPSARVMRALRRAEPGLVADLLLLVRREQPPAEEDDAASVAEILALECLAEVLMNDTAALCDHERLQRGLGVAAGQRDGLIFALFERASANLAAVAVALRGADVSDATITQQLGVLKTTEKIILLTNHICWQDEGVAARLGASRIVQLSLETLGGELPALGSTRVSATLAVAIELQFYGCLACVSLLLETLTCEDSGARRQLNECGGAELIVSSLHRNLGLGAVAEDSATDSILSIPQSRRMLCFCLTRFVSSLMHSRSQHQHQHADTRALITDRLGNRGDDKLTQVLCTVFAGAGSVGGALVAQTTQLLIDAVNENPTSLPKVHECGLAASFFDALAEDRIPAYPDVVSRLPSAVRVLTLTRDARTTLLATRKPKAIVLTLLRQRSCSTGPRALTERHNEPHDQLQDSVASEVGSELVDLLRESSIFRLPAVEAIVETLVALEQRLAAAPGFGATAAGLTEFVRCQQAVRWIAKVAQKLYAPGKVEGLDDISATLDCLLAVLETWSQLAVPLAVEGSATPISAQYRYADELRRSAGQSQLKLLRVLAQINSSDVVERTVLKLHAAIAAGQQNLAKSPTSAKQLERESWLIMVLAELFRSEAKAAEVGRLPADSTKTRQAHLLLCIEKLNASFDIRSSSASFLAHLFVRHQQHRWDLASMEWDHYVNHHRISPSDSVRTTLLPSRLAEKRPSFEVSETKLLLSAPGENLTSKQLQIRALRTCVECVVIFLSALDATTALLRRSLADVPEVNVPPHLKATNEAVARMFCDLGDQVQASLEGLTPLARDGADGDRVDRELGIACFCLTSFCFALETCLLDVQDNTIKLAFLGALVRDGGLYSVLHAAHSVSDCSAIVSRSGSLIEQLLSDSVSVAAARMMELVSTACGSMREEVVDQLKSESSYLVFLEAIGVVVEKIIAPYVVGNSSLDYRSVPSFILALRCVLENTTNLIEERAVEEEHESFAVAGGGNVPFHDDAVLAHLLGMGFERETALQALETCRVASGSERIDVSAAEAVVTIATRRSSPNKRVRLSPGNEIGDEGASSSSVSSSASEEAAPHHPSLLIAAQVRKALDSIAQKCTGLVLSVLQRDTGASRESEMSVIVLVGGLLGVLVRTKRVVLGTIFDECFSCVMKLVGAFELSPRKNFVNPSFSKVLRLLDDLMYRFWPEPVVAEVMLRKQMEPLIVRLTRRLAEASVRLESGENEDVIFWMAPALYILTRFLQTRSIDGAVRVTLSIEEEGKRSSESIDLVAVCIRLLRSKPEPEQCRAAMRLLAALVASPRAAHQFVMSGGVDALIRLPASSSFAGIRRLSATLILRGVDYRGSIETAMEMEIKRAMQRLRKLHESDDIRLFQLLALLVKVVGRHPRYFADVLFRLVEITKLGNNDDENPAIRLSERRALESKRKEESTSAVTLHVLQSLVGSLRTSSPSPQGAARASSASTRKGFALSERTLYRLLKQLVQKSSRSSVALTKCLALSTSAPGSASASTPASASASTSAPPSAAADESSRSSVGPRVAPSAPASAAVASAPKSSLRSPHSTLSPNSFVTFLLSRIPTVSDAFTETHFRSWSKDAAVQLLLSLSLSSKKTRTDLLIRASAALQRTLPTLPTTLEIKGLKRWVQLATAFIEAAMKASEERGSDRQQREELLLDLVAAQIPTALLRCLCNLPRSSAYAADLATSIIFPLLILSMPETVKICEGARKRQRKRAQGKAFSPSPRPRTRRRRGRSRSGSILSEMGGSMGGGRSRSNSIALVLTTGANGEMELQQLNVQLAAEPLLLPQPHMRAVPLPGVSDDNWDPNDKGEMVVDESSSMMMTGQDQLELQAAFDQAESPSRGRGSVVSIAEDSPGGAITIDVDINADGVMMTMDDVDDEIDLSDEMALLEVGDDNDALGALLDAATMAGVDDEDDDLRSDDDFNASSDEDDEGRAVRYIYKPYIGDMDESNPSIESQSVETGARQLVKNLGGDWESISEEERGEYRLAHMEQIENINALAQESSIRQTHLLVSSSRMHLGTARVAEADRLEMKFAGTMLEKAMRNHGRGDRREGRTHTGMERVSPDRREQQLSWSGWEWQCVAPLHLSDFWKYIRTLTSKLRMKWTPSMAKNAARCAKSACVAAKAAVAAAAWEAAAAAALAVPKKKESEGGAPRRKRAGSVRCHTHARIHTPHTARSPPPHTHTHTSSVSLQLDRSHVVDALEAVIREAGAGAEALEGSGGGLIFDIAALEGGESSSIGTGIDPEQMLLQQAIALAAAAEAAEDGGDEDDGSSSDDDDEEEEDDDDDDEDDDDDDEDLMQRSGPHSALEAHRDALEALGFDFMTLMPQSGGAAEGAPLLELTDISGPPLIDISSVSIDSVLDVITFLLSSGDSSNALQRCLNAFLQNVVRHASARRAIAEVMFQLIMSNSLLPKKKKETQLAVPAVRPRPRRRQSLQLLCDQGQANKHLLIDLIAASKEHLLGSGTPDASAMQPFFELILRAESKSVKRGMSSKAEYLSLLLRLLELLTRAAKDVKVAETVVARVRDEESKEEVEELETKIGEDGEAGAAAAVTISSTPAASLISQPLLQGIVDVLLADVGALTPRDHVNTAAIVTRIAKDNRVALMALMTRAATELAAPIRMTMESLVADGASTHLLEMKPSPEEHKLMRVLSAASDIKAAAAAAAAEAARAAALRCGFASVDHDDFLFDSGTLTELWSCLESTLDTLRTRERSGSMSDSVASASASASSSASTSANDSASTSLAVTTSLPSASEVSATESSSAAESVGVTVEGDVSRRSNNNVPLKRLCERFAPLIQAFGISHSFSASASATLVRFCESNALMLNVLVRQFPALVTGVAGRKASISEAPLRFLLLKPACRIVLDFDNKRTLFKHALDAMQKKRQQRTGRPPVEMGVSRARVLEDSYAHIAQMRRSRIPLYTKFQVAFTGEEGIDAGGLTREWYSILAKQIFNPGYALFTPAADSPTFQPNPESGINREHLGYFKFVGFVVGRALLSGVHFDAPFNTSFYKHLLGRSVLFEDLESLDPQLYKNLCQLLEIDPDDVEDLDLTFSVRRKGIFGDVEIDLAPLSRSDAVTGENVKQYVELYAQWRMTKSIRDQIDSFVTGFYELVDKDILASFAFTSSELELLISGMPSIDLDDLEKNTTYKNCRASDSAIIWFWDALRSFEEEDLAKFLVFVTGTSKVPLDGFKGLQGMRGPQRFNIKLRSPPRGGETLCVRLPEAHTCFNSLELPAYDSFEVMREKLLLSVRESGSFALA